VSIGIAIGNAVLILSFYIGWRIYREEGKQFSGVKQFSIVRNFGIFFRSIGGTNFQNAILIESNFSNAVLDGARFNKDTIIHRTIFKDANEIRLARLSGTIMENRHVRDMLVTGQTDQKSFVGVNLKGAYLKDVDLTGIDFTEADLSDATLENANLKNTKFIGASLINTKLNNADITESNLYGSGRDNWQIDGIKCDCVYFDPEGKKMHSRRSLFQSW